MVIEGSTGGMGACLRETSIIKGVTNYINIKAAPYLELIADEVRDVNGRDNYWKPVHFNALNGNEGVILFKGGATSLNFEYDHKIDLPGGVTNLKFKYNPKTGLYLPKDAKPKPLTQRTKDLPE